MRPVFRTTGRFVEKPRAPMMLLSNGQRIAPSLVYDFLQSADPIIPAGLTTTKSISANGTYVNSAGLITQGTSNVWPMDYSPSTLQPLGRRVEEARTNLLLRSQELDNLVWTPVRGSVTANSATSPDGTTNADTFNEDATAANSHELRQVVSKAASSITYAYSMFFKASGRNFVNITLWDGAANGVRRYFNISSGSVGSAASFGAGFTEVGSSIESHPNGWYRATLIATSNTATSIAVILYSCEADGSLTPAVGLNGPAYFGYGAQLEAGSFASSYIPTTTVAVTRAADALSIPTGSWFNASEGTIVAEFIPSTAVTNATDQTILTVTDGTLNEIYSLYRLNTSGNASLYVADGGVAQASITNGGVTAQSTASKAAFGYAVNNFGLVANGGTVRTDTSGTLPSPTTFYLGSTNGTSVFLNGWLRKLYYYPVRLSDNRLIGLSI